MTPTELYNAKANRLMELTGVRFGSYTVIQRDGVIHHRAAWKIECDCGHTETVLGDSLRKRTNNHCTHKVAA